MKDGGPAFPHPNPNYSQDYGLHQPFGGMSLRDWFAGQALAGMASIALDDGDMLMGWAEMSTAAYRAADAMLAARGGGSS